MGLTRCFQLELVLWDWAAFWLGKECVFFFFSGGSCGLDVSHIHGKDVVGFFLNPVQRAIQRGLGPQLAEPGLELMDHWGAVEEWGVCSAEAWLGWAVCQAPWLRES